MTQAPLDFHNMTSQITQEQIDLQNKLEMHTTDFITKPLSNDSAVLFLDHKETPDNPLTDQMEHQNIPSKNKHDQMEHQNIPSKNKTPSNRFSFKSQLLLSICTQLITLSNSMIKTKTSSLLSLLKLWHHITTGLTTASKYFLFNLIFSAHPYMISKLMKKIRPSFLPHKKTTHLLTYTRFLQHNKPQIYNFANCKYTSPLTMTNLYTIDHSKITGYLRNYDPIKQDFCLLPHNGTARPLIVPQECLIHFDDFLLPCNIPTQIVKPSTVIKHLVSSPLDDKDISYYTALSKQSHSYNELLFIAAKTITYMVQTEQNHTVQTEQKHCYTNQKSPPKLAKNFPTC